MDEWLREFINVSPYDVSVANVSKSRTDWITQCHGKAGPNELKLLWTGLAFQLGSKTGDYKIESILYFLNINKEIFKYKFKGLVKSNDIDDLIGFKLKEWWIEISDG